MTCMHLCLGSQLSRWLRKTLELKEVRCLGFKQAAALGPASERMHWCWKLMLKKVSNY